MGHGHRGLSVLGKVCRREWANSLQIPMKGVSCWIEREARKSFENVHPGSCFVCGVIARKTKELMCLHLVLIPPDYLLCPSRPVTIPEPFLGHVINAGTSGSCQNIIHVKMYISYITSS